MGMLCAILEEIKIKVHSNSSPYKILVMLRKLQSFAIYVGCFFWGAITPLSHYRDVPTGYMHSVGYMIIANMFLIFTFSQASLENVLPNKSHRKFSLGALCIGLGLMIIAFLYYFHPLMRSTYVAIGKPSPTTLDFDPQVIYYWTFGANLVIGLTLLGILLHASDEKYVKNNRVVKADEEEAS